MPGKENKIPRYLQNTKEVTQPEESQFSGKIPSWLKGTLYTSAPGIFDLANGSVNNWFDGYAILSKFCVDGAKVTFSSKYLRSNAYKKAIEAGKPILTEFGTPPSTDSTSGKKFLAKLIPFGPYDCTDNTIGTIFKIGNNIYNAGDTCYLHEFDPQSLDIIQTYHAFKAYGMNSTSCLPLEDDNGDVYQIGGVIQPTFRYHVLKMSAKNRDKKLEKRFETLISFPSRWMFGACPCRNFGMTKNYIIMIEMPLVLNLMKLAATYIKGYCATDWLDWRPEDGVRFYLVHKGTGEVLKTEIYSVNPFITPIVVNAFENSDDEVVIDLITVPNMDCNKALVLNTLRSAKHLYKGKNNSNIMNINGNINNQDEEENETGNNLETGRIHRYIIPLVKDIQKYSEGQSLLKSKSNLYYSQVDATRKGQRVILTPEIISGKDRGFDFTMINPNFRGKKYKFTYIVSGYISTTFSPLANGIGKFNMDTKEIVQMWHGKPGQVPSEPKFIPKSNPNNGNQSEEEDDGILLTIVRNENSYEEDDFLVAVDAKTMEEVGRAYFKSEIAGWTHSLFLKG